MPASADQVRVGWGEGGGRHARSATHSCPAPCARAQVAPRPEAIATLREVAAAVSHELGAAEVLREQACYLPCSPDGVPLIGRVPELENAYVATGGVGGWVGKRRAGRPPALASTATRPPLLRQATAAGASSTRPPPGWRSPSSSLTARLLVWISARLTRSACQSSARGAGGGAAHAASPAALHAPPPPSPCDTHSSLCTLDTGSHDCSRARTPRHMRAIAMQLTGKTAVVTGEMGAAAAGAGRAWGARSEGVEQRRRSRSSSRCTFRCRGQPGHRPRGEGGRLGGAASGDRARERASRRRRRSTYPHTRPPAHPRSSPASWPRAATW